MRVKCPKCKRTTTYVTTDKYAPSIKPHGAMLRLSNPKHRGGRLYYSTPKGLKTTPATSMTCIDCGALLAFGGRLRVFTDDQLARQRTQRDIEREWSAYEKD